MFRVARMKFQLNLPLFQNLCDCIILQKLSKKKKIVFLIFEYILKSYKPVVN